MKSAAATSQTMLGETIGPYRIIEKLGAGAMGEVYKARHERLNRLVAIKMISADRMSDPERRRRFLQEAQAASALNHPNIVAIHDMISAGVRELLIMEFVAGKTLNSLIPAGGMEWKQALSYAVPIAGALACAHAAGIIHRDLKPQNIMITGEGIPKLLDFGLAKLTLPTGNEQTLTDLDLGQSLEGAIIGTLPYMSPEQAEGRHIDTRSDIFAFGAVLYEMLTGCRAFRGESSISTLMAVMRDAPIPAREHVPGIPAELDEIITRCLQKDADERFQSMREVEQALQALQTPSSSGIRLPVARPVPSIAVLPFANLSGDKENEYFSDGLSEDIITALARLPGLRVAPRTSAFAFRGKEQDLRTVATTLKVAHVLEGSVRRAGNRIRITSQLVDALQGSHLWSERFDRELMDIFAVQDEISQKIVEMLKVKLTGAPKPAIEQHTSNMEAYNLYLKGRHRYYQWTFDAIQESRMYFEKALALDPSYALALGSLATCDSALATFGWVAPRQIMGGCRQAFEKAIGIDDSISELHWSLAVILTWYEHDWVNAEREFLKALEMEPSSPLGHWAYGELFLGPAGRLQEALIHVKRAVELDPLNMNVIVAVADVHRHMRDYEAAIEICHKAAEIAPQFYIPYWYLGLNYALKGNIAEAIAEGEKAMELSGRMPWVLGDLGYIYGVAGKTDEARAVLAELTHRSERAYVSPCSIARVYVGLSEWNEAFEYFDKAIEGRDPSVMWLTTDPAFDQLRSDRRYEALAPKLHRRG